MKTTLRCGSLAGLWILFIVVVVAGCSKDNSSEPETKANLPSAPTAVVAESEEYSAKLSWTAPADNGGAPITGYTVKSLPEGVSLQTGPDTQVAVVGLTAGKAYTFTVQATNEAGTGSASTPSNEISLPTPPGAPLNVKAMNVPGGVIVTWSPPASDGGRPIIHYTVSSFQSGLQISTSEDSATFENLPLGVSDTFWVYATNELGDGPAVTTEPFTRTAGFPDWQHSSFSASPARLAVGHSQSTIRIEVRDNSGAPAAGQTVSLVATGSGTVLSASNGLTDSSGRFVARLSSTEPGTKTIAVSVGGLFWQSTVTFVAPACEKTTSFSSLSSVPTTHAPQGTSVLADFNSDGALDLVVGGAQLVLHAGNGDGNFQSAQVITDSVSTSVLVSGDFTRDGILDLATPDLGGHLNVLPGRGDGTFKTAILSNLPAKTLALATADFNNDGVPDLVAGGDTVSVLLGVGDGTFQEATTVGTYNGVEQVLVADITGDGQKDIVFHTSDTVRYLPGVGDGTFLQAFSIAVANASGLAVEDLTGDGSPEVLTLSNGVLAVLLNDGTGQLKPLGNGPALEGEFTTGDLDNDGVTDLVSSTTGEVSVWFGMGDGTFSPAVPVSLVGTPAAISIDDLDGDGRAELAVTTIAMNGDASVVVLGNQCTEPPPPAPLPVVTGVVATAGNASADVTWAAASSADPILNYAVTTWPAGTSTLVSGTATSATIGGLTNGQKYTFTVHVITQAGAGPDSAPSNIVVPGVRPAAPTNVTAKAGNKSAVVSWTAPAGEVLTYTVKAIPGNDTRVVLGTTVLFENLTNGVSYTFTVHASNLVGDGSESAPSSAVIPATVPGAPTDVFADTTETTGRVIWKAPHDKGGSSILQYTITAVPSGATQTTDGSASSVTFTGLVTETAYTFVVSATNAIGTGPASLPSLPSTTGPMADATQSTFVASPATAVAATGAQITLTVTLKDAAGNPLANRGVLLSSSGTNNSFSVLLGNTNASGVFVSQLSSTQPELKQLTAVGAGVTLRTHARFLSPPCSQQTTLGPGTLTTVAGTAIAFFDFDEDGNLDIAYATTTGIAVIPGVGNGTFGLPLVTPVAGIRRVFSMIGVDLNHDSHADVVTVGDDGPTVHLGRGDGTFIAGAPLPGTTWGARIITNDFNEDGEVDLMVSNDVDTILVFRGNGDGTFQPALPVSAGGVVTVVTGDFDHDGHADLAYSNNWSANTDVRLGNGDGTFKVVKSYAPVHFENTGLYAGDFNNDGWLDFAVTGAGSSQMALQLNDQTGAFVRKGNYTLDVPGEMVIGADMNGDGNLDAIVGKPWGGGICVLLGNGDGTFQPFQTYYPRGGDPHYAYVADINGDGRPDVVDMTTGGVTVGLNQCGP